MLILARQPGESIIIDGVIQVTVLEVAKNGTVRLGINAPRSHRVYREELFRAIQEENRTATVIEPGQMPDVLGLLPPRP